MATVTIVIEDLINGKISVRATPNLATIAKMRIDQQLTPCEEVAVMALREIHNKFKVAKEIEQRGLFARIFGTMKS